MMSFFSRLTARAVQADTLLCVGLDPHEEFLPDPSAGAARDFCLRLIRATADLACAFKPNSAFFEVYGAQGLEVLREVIAAVPKGTPVILDAKRGDIATSAQAYARTAFETLGADAVTVNPYLGRDSLEPFLTDPERGTFVLCRTSNPGAMDLQSLRVEGGEPLYVHVAQAATTWNAQDNVGLVVAATEPKALAAVRAAAPNLWILAPGVGAQGGDLEAAVRAGMRTDGLGLLVTISRSLARSPDLRGEAERVRLVINRVRAQVEARPTSRLGENLAALANDLLEAGCVRFGDFTLRSGQKSPIYLDLRRLVSHPALLTETAAAYLPLLARLSYDRLAALPYAALPIATVLALQTGRPMVYPRKEVKEYGTREAVEGDFSPGETVVVVDDVATTGVSKFEAIERLQAAGLVVQDLAVLIDREGGAAEALARAGYRLHAVFTLSALLDHWQMTQRISEAQADSVRAFLETPSD